MKLTPLDIRKQDFTRGFRGYDADEVQAFLQMVSSQWEELLNAERRLTQRVEELESKVRHYEKVEEALHEALETSRQTARQIVESAQHKAQAIIDEAEARSGDVKRHAEAERLRIRRETSRLNGRRNEIVARLRAFLMSELELLAKFEGDDPIGFIKLLPGGQRAEAAPDEPPPAEAGPRPQAPPDRPAEAPRAREAAEEAAPRPARPAPPGEPDAPPAPEPEVEQEAPAANWIVRPVVSSPDAPPAPAQQPEDDQLAASADEIERIRRILRDLD